MGMGARESSEQLVEHEALLLSCADGRHFLFHAHATRGAWRYETQSTSPYEPPAGVALGNTSMGFEEIDDRLRAWCHERVAPGDGCRPMHTEVLDLLGVIEVAGTNTLSRVMLASPSTTSAFRPLTSW
jgi:hypothetical protein